jgi:hypothetical protein
MNLKRVTEGCVEALLGMRNSRFRNVKQVLPLSALDTQPRILFNPLFYGKFLARNPLDGNLSQTPRNYGSVAVPQDNLRYV